MKRTAIIATMLLLAAAAPWGANHAHAQGGDSTCLVLWQYSPLRYELGSDIAWRNDDSVKVDMCSGPQYFQEFGKNDFGAYFRYYIIPIPDSLAAKGADTVIHTWRDIDSSYSSLRDSFQRIEQRFGSFTLQHVSVGAGDTSGAGNKAWKINFDIYLNIDTIDTTISRLPDINPALGCWSPGPSWYESVNANTAISNIRIWPEPSFSAVHIFGTEITANANFFDPLGREVTFPTSLSDNVLTVDVSKQPDGIIYCAVSGHVIKILIHH